MRLEASKKTDIALKTLTFLHTHSDANGAAIAEEVETTTNYLPQLLRPLIVNGWICSTPGPGGGYRLCVDLEELTVLDVIEAVEGVTDEDQCVLRGAPCPAPEPCALHDSWVRARDALLAELGSTSVATTLVPTPTKGE